MFLAQYYEQAEIFPCAVFKNISCTRSGSVSPVIQKLHMHTFTDDKLLCSKLRGLTKIQICFWGTDTDKGTYTVGFVLRRFTFTTLVESDRALPTCGASLSQLKRPFST